MLERIKLGFILFLDDLKANRMAWEEIKRVMDEEKISRLSTLSHIC